MHGLEALLREEAWRPLSVDLPVLRSSNGIVEALRGEMRDCTSRVTRGKPLLDLAAVFQVGGWFGWLGSHSCVWRCCCCLYRLH